MFEYSEQVRYLSHVHIDESNEDQNPEQQGHQEEDSLISSTPSEICPDCNDRSFMARLDYIDWHSHSLQIKDFRRISVWNYRLNLLRLIILWSASCFTSEFMTYENKYFEGTIFIYYYYEGITGVVASLLASALYAWL